LFTFVGEDYSVGGGDMIMQK